MDTIVITTPEEALQFREELKLEMQLTRKIINDGIESNSDGLIITPAYILNQQKIISLVNAVSDWRQSNPARVHRIRDQMCENELLFSALEQNLLVLNPDYLENRDLALRLIPMEMLELKQELRSLELQ
jgi:hypothetical protein